MNIKTLFRSGCVLAVLGIASVAWAHHAAVGFDRNKRMIFTGTVEEFAWVNPHAFIYINVMKKDGKTELWGFETGGAARLNRAGWQKSDFPHGAKISIYATAATNGSRNALCSKIVLADGRELVAVDTGVTGSLNPDGLPAGAFGGAPGGARGGAPGGAPGGPPGGPRGAAADYVKYE